MKITINARDSKITAGMEEKIFKKFQFLNKYLKDSDEVNVFIKKGKLNHKVKVVMPTVSNETLVVKHEDNDFYSCVDVLADKVKETYLQNKKRYIDGKKHGLKKHGLAYDMDEEVIPESEFEIYPETESAISLKFE